MEISEQETATVSREKRSAAFVGAAIGDALGWPQEARAGKVGRQATSPPAMVFRQWQRRAGGRFYAHAEIIGPGEYSDDTQLLLATARSISHRTAWLKHFVQKELPAWLTYERGGGGATRRAAEAWSSGTRPWADNDEKRRAAYFQAGGNGVAMRILPHILACAAPAEFERVNELIVLNGITTHGHPRALVGSVLYGFASWVALNQVGTLPYGYLLEVALKRVDDWGKLPKCEMPDDWLGDRSERADYDKLWRATVEEARHLIAVAADGLRAGALANDRSILRDLGAIDSSFIGSGTVSAVAAIYLASKYAPDPQHGVAEAAFAKGADTDTLASMTGALLGLIAGAEWIQPYAGTVQDHAYLKKIADSLIDCECSLPEISDLGHRRTADIKRFWSEMQSASVGTDVMLSDGRRGAVQEIHPVEMRTKSVQGTLWKVNASDGQTLFFKRLERIAPTKQSEMPFPTEAPNQASAFRASVQAVKLRVKSLERAHRFYGEILGLPVVRQSRNAMNFGGILTFVTSDYLGPELQDALLPSIICIETDSLEKARIRLASAGCTSLKQIETKGGLRFFSCRDFEGNVVEIFERAPQQT